MWKGGEAPGPEDPYSPESSQALRQQMLERELAQAEAELAAYEADAKDYVAAQRSERNGRPRPKSRLAPKVKNPRVWAPTETESEAQGYVPAKSVEGLEEIGGIEGWWEQEGRWGKESAYVGFSRGDKVVDADVCEALVRQAVVEALAVAGSPEQGRLTATWAKGGRKSFRRTLGLGLKVGEDGSAALESDAEAAQTVVDRLFVAQPKNAKVSEASVTPEEAKELIKSWGSSWKSISLQDARFKFAVSPSFV